MLRELWSKDLIFQFILRAFWLFLAVIFLFLIYFVLNFQWVNWRSIFHLANHTLHIVFRNTEVLWVISLIVNEISCRKIKFCRFKSFICHNSFSIAYHKPTWRNVIDISGGIIKFWNYSLNALLSVLKLLWRVFHITDCFIKLYRLLHLRIDYCCRFNLLLEYRSCKVLWMLNRFFSFLGCLFVKNLNSLKFLQHLGIKESLLRIVLNENLGITWTVT